MKIQVYCAGNTDPHWLYLGARRLHIMRVLERAAEDSLRRFRVRMADGRELILRYDLETDEWHLASVIAPPKGAR